MHNEKNVVAIPLSSSTPLQMEEHTIGLFHAIGEEGGVLGEIEGRIPLLVPAN